MAAPIVLPTTKFVAAQARRHELCNTIIENTPQVSVKRAPPHTLLSPKATFASPISDDFPTPKAVPSFNIDHPRDATKHNYFSSPASSDTQSESSSVWSKRSSSASFDSMYDISSSEGEDVPIKLSSSVKKRVANMRKRPSLKIPDPDQWPTIHNHKAVSTPLSPSVLLQLSPAVLKHFHTRTLKVPSTSSAPSLDGSLTSEELASSSCPSTPDLERNERHTWEVPLQLDPTAYTMLQNIGGGLGPEQETVIEVPSEVVQEMREVVDSPRRLGGLQLDTSSLQPVKSLDSQNELSALTIPSPGNFFSSLDSMARQAWAGSDGPNTSIATEFYNLPFNKDDIPPVPALPASLKDSSTTTAAEHPTEDIIKQTIVVTSAISGPKSPVTARRSLFNAIETYQQEEVDEIDQDYHSTLQKVATEHIDRTQLWLLTQKAHIDSALTEEDVLAESFKDIDGVAPRTPDQASPCNTDNSPSGKKSVRFADTTPKEEPAPLTEDAKKKRISPIHDGTFWQGWCHAKRSQRARDVFQHRQMRAEAEQIRRSNTLKVHADQLKGHFEIAAADRPVPSRPVSGFVDNAPALAPEDQQRREVIAAAVREQQALEQIQSSTWHVQAQKELNGGTLLTSPVVATFKTRQDVNILDLAGQTHCSWAWDVAVTHPNAKIFTTVSSDLEAHIAESSVEGPVNHCVVAAPRLWELPFENNLFDVISARNLYMHLRTHIPGNQDVDEWDLTLRECMRVLKPGGYLEFDLLDAELMNPAAAAQALGVEFAFNLKTRGYDPCSGKSFLPRLKRAGFRNIKRAWIVLPVANHMPRWTDDGKTARPKALRIATPDTGSTFQFGAAGPETPESSKLTPLTGSTQDVRAITGLVGARSWEQWMLKLNTEAGRGDERSLQGVGKALEESGLGNSGWRCLVGWAKKAE